MSQCRFQDNRAASGINKAGMVLAAQSACQSHTMQHPEEAILAACAPQGDAMILFM